MPCDDLAGWDEEGGKRVQEGGVIYIPMADFMLYGRKLYNVVKKISSN